MYLVHDLDHFGGGGEDLYETLVETFEEAGDPTVLVEGPYVSAAQRDRKLAFYNVYARGNATLHPPEGAPDNFGSDESDRSSGALAGSDVAPDSWVIVHDSFDDDADHEHNYRSATADERYYVVSDGEYPSDVSLLRAAREADGDVTFRGFPVHGETAEFGEPTEDASVEAVGEAIAGSEPLYDKPADELTAQEQALLASLVRARDDINAASVIDRVEDGDLDGENTVAFVGGGHRLKERVEGRLDVVERNAPDEYEGELLGQRNTVRDVLANTAVGHVVGRDADAVAADTGYERAQARLAVVGAKLRADDRFRAAAGDWLDEFEAVVTADPDTATGRERIARLRSAVVDRLDDHVDLRSAFAHGDLSPDPPSTDDRPGGAVGVVVDELFPNRTDERRVRSAVADAVDPGAVDPERVAAVAEALDGRGVTAGPVDPAARRTEATARYEAWSRPPAIDRIESALSAFGLSGGREGSLTEGLVGRLVGRVHGRTDAGADPPAGDGRSVGDADAVGGGRVD